MKHIISILLLLLCPIIAISQQVKFFDAQYSLPGSLIDRIYQDQNGNIWLLGKSGAIKYDGFLFHRVKHEFTNSPNSPSYRCIYFGENNVTYFGTSRGVIYNDNKNDSSKLIKLSLQDSVINSGFISSMVYCKSLEALIITVSGNGLVALDCKTNTPITNLTQTLNSLCQTIYPGTLYLDSYNCLWTFSSEGNFIKINLNDFTRDNLILPNQESDVINCVSEDPKTGDMLIGTNHHGILKYIRKDGSIQTTKPSTNITGRINSIVCPSDYENHNCFWIGSEDNGLMIYNNESQEITIPKLKSDRVDLKNCKIHDIIEDNQGNIWAAVFQKGIVLIPKTAITFSCITINKTALTNIAPVTAIIGTQDGYLWAGTDGGGLFKLLPNNTNERFYTNNCNLPNNSILALATDNDNNLWISTFMGGLSRLDANGKLENIPYKSSFQRIQRMIFDSITNSLYLGTLGDGTFVLKLNKNKIEQIKNLPYPKWVNSMFIDSKHRVIINSTIFQNDTIIKMCIDDLLIDKQINSVVEDNEHNLWFGGESWLTKYSVIDNTLKEIPKNEYSGFIQSMLIDKYNNIWYSTEDKLVRFNEKENKYESFTTLDGLPSNEFCVNSVYQNNEGDIYMGTNGGIALFSPVESLPKINLTSKITFSNFAVAGESVKFNANSNENILDAPINFAENAILKNNQNNFSIQFGITEYANPHRLNFRYRLKNFDNNWYHASILNRTVSFTNIPEGEYVFEVEAFFDDESSKSCKSINIKVLPPWYNTWPAYIIYFVVGLCIIMVIVFIIKYKLSLKHQQAENNKKEMRLQMFTNLSHEIRTPLSLVVTPLNSLIDNENDARKSAILKLMKRNVQRVTSQLNRIMDIRKIDNNKFSLKLKNMNMVDFLGDIVKSFDQLSLMRNININLKTNNFDTIFAFDPDNFDKVVFNILSNAFKFTPDGGFININLEQTLYNNEDFALLRIENSGSSIPPDEYNKVFDRFYQTSNNTLNEGSGIGLHLAKMIIDAHNGNINVHNTENGVEFSIYLPIITIEEQNVENIDNKIEISKSLTNNLETNHFIDYQNTESQDIQPNKNLKKVLFIDDDKDWTGYIAMALSDKFNTIVCNKPENAMNQIITCEPDAIVTDLVMPNCDGFEICKKVRQTPQTSLLPIIILTSNIDEENKRICVEIGADHFLTKPVNLNLLKSSITNAINTREHLLNKVTADIHANKNVINAQSPDAILLKKVIDAIINNIGINSFGVNELSQKIGISRVHLNRKLKELMNITPVNLIKSIKMKHAARLLVVNKLNVADVAYKLGFSSHSYFSSHFREYFGISPTEFVAKYSSPENKADLEKIINYDINKSN
ncbi:MAG: helix-turn-helix domain-containing protein [Bacteroidales bacterium]|nr:helix-turn-helix domain-containing protein [Bacteroidales bacterium]